MFRAFFVITAIAIAFPAVWLLDDSSTYALQAARPGKPRGCYTKVDDWFGARVPSTWRATETVVGLGLLGTSGTLVFLFLRKPHRAA